jgi:hypothetical protein
MKIIKQALSVTLRVGMSIALLVFLFKQVDERIMFATIKKADKNLLAWAFIIYLTTYILCLYRWQMLLKAASLNLPFKRVIISFAAGIFFSLFLPSSIGGDFMRSLDLAVFTKKPRQVIATVLLDRLSGYVGLVILTLLAVFFGWSLIRDPSVVISVSILIALLIAVLLILFNKFVYSKINKFLHSSGAGRIREAITNLHREIHYFRNNKKVMLNNVILSTVIQAIAPLTFYMIALAIGIKIKLVYFFIFLPIIGAITLLPISIGGLGLRDAMTVFFFAKVGVVKDLAFAMSLISFLFILIYGSIGGLIYVLTIHYRRIQPHQPSAVRPSQ